jgi:pyrroloquinoline quinone biosynthesis protein B
MSSYAPSVEDNIAIRVRTATSGDLVYASAISDAESARSFLTGAAALLFDGTFWSENELPELGVNMGPARTMAHQPISGVAGSLRALRDLEVPRRIFTHINNTNPLLDANSAEFAEVAAMGWEIALDGMQLCIE